MTREERKAKRERHEIKTESAEFWKFADGCFTLLAVTWFIVGMVYFATGEGDKGVSRLTLGLLFWIASTQLQPYWDRYAPTRCAHQPEDPDKV